MREAFCSGRGGGPATGVPGLMPGVPGSAIGVPGTVREEETP